MGIHERQPDPQRFPPMARLRPPHAAAAMALDRERAGRRDSSHRCVLDPEDPHVLHQLRLGDVAGRQGAAARADPVASSSRRRGPPHGLVLRYLDLPDAHLFELGGNSGRGLELGSHPAHRR